MTLWTKAPLQARPCNIAFVLSAAIHPITLVIIHEVSFGNLHTSLWKTLSCSFGIIFSTFHPVRIFIPSILIPKRARKNVAYLPHAYFGTVKCKKCHLSMILLRGNNTWHMQVFLWLVEHWTRMPHEVASLQFDSYGTREKRWFALNKTKKGLCNADS